MKQSEGHPGRKPRANEILDHLERIEASTTFRGSVKLQRILHFMVREAVNGNRSHIKEVTIGLEIYGHASDSARQSAIRTAVGRLRAKLAIYYKEEGRNDSLRIEIPVGRYAPVFRPYQPSSQEGAITGVRVKSCAVLPLRTLGSGPCASELADGITDELIYALTRVPGLRVISRTSSFQFRNVEIDVREIARRLGAEAILEGSIQCSDHEMQVSLQMTDGRDGLHLWSDRHSGSMSAFPQMQEALVRSVRAGLRPNDPNGAIFQAAPGSLTSWSLYRQGRFHWEKRTPAGWREAIRCFTEVLGEDPQYALAHAGIAETYIHLANFGEARAVDVMPRAKLSAETALAIDPTLAEGHAALGAVKSLYEWDWEGSEREYRLALRLNPSSAQCHFWYARVLSSLRRHKEAEAEMDLALKLDPVSPGIYVNAGAVALEAGAYDRALGLLRKALEFNNEFAFAHWHLGIALLEMGHAAEGVEALERVLRGAPDMPRLWAFLGYAYGIAGQRQDAMELLRRLEDEAAGRYISPLDIALPHIGLGNTEKAMQFVERAASERDTFLSWLSSAPYWQRLNTEPGFQKVLEHMGLRF